MEKQIFSALIAILFALSGWALHSVNRLQVEMGQVQVMHVGSEEIYKLRRQVDRLEYLLEGQAMVK